MNPDFFPELALIFAGLVAAVVAAHKLVKRQGFHALGTLAVCVGCIALAVFLGKSSLHGYDPKTWQGWQASLALSPASPPDSIEGPPPNEMFLMLGNVLVKTLPSSHYTLTMDDEPFMELNLTGRGLVVSCVVLPESTVTVPITGNMFTRNIPAGVHLTKPDPHTILLVQKDKHIFRIRYASQRRIDVAGVFQCDKCMSPIVLAADKGIRWEGGAVSPGATIDLSPQGRGIINLETSGRISISRNQ